MYEDVDELGHRLRFFHARWRLSPTELLTSNSSVMQYLSILHQTELHYDKPRSEAIEVAFGHGNFFSLQLSAGN